MLYQAEPLPDVGRRHMACMRLDRLDPYYNIRKDRSVLARWRYQPAEVAARTAICPKAAGALR